MGFWKNLLPGFVFDPVNIWLRDHWGTPKKTYAGEGEDLILQKIFNGKTNGFFVDIGCYHPIVGSNTYVFHRKYHWSGINVDANPDSIIKFNKLRQQDINLNVGVGPANAESLRFHRFSEGALNTFSEKIKEERIHRDKQRYLGSIEVPVWTLERLLDTHAHGREIDFIDVDVEGLDLEVLQSNNWQKYRPRIVMVEDQLKVSDAFTSLPTYQFLRDQQYVLIAKTYSTLFFAEKDFAEALYY
jgi:FkbM family methyltransferase